jgi:hypothetical protein
MYNSTGGDTRVAEVDKELFFSFISPHSRQASSQIPV